MIKNLKNYIVDLGKVIISENVASMREAIQQLVKHAEDGQKKMEDMDATINALIVEKNRYMLEAERLKKELEEKTSLYKSAIKVYDSYRKNVTERQEMIREMEYVSKVLEREAVKIFKARNESPAQALTEEFLVEIEKLMMDKAQKIRVFLLMRDMM